LSYLRAFATGLPLFTHHSVFLVAHKGCSAALQEEHMTEKQAVIVSHEKSTALAYVLLIFLGQLGIHRFYLGRVGTGLAQLLLGVVGWATAWIVIGLCPSLFLECG
jgi:TM2 domain-containing membrane protein YozV